MNDISSRPYKPLMACERCAFGRGQHARWCSVWEEWDAIMLQGGWEQVDPGKIEWTYTFSEPVQYK